jgi:hypothetical protein
VHSTTSATSPRSRVVHRPQRGDVIRQHLLLLCVMRCGSRLSSTVTFDLADQVCTAKSQWNESAAFALRFIELRREIHCRSRQDPRYAV